MVLVIFFPKYQRFEEELKIEKLGVVWCNVIIFEFQPEIFELLVRKFVIQKLKGFPNCVWWFLDHNWSFEVMSKYENVGKAMM